MNKGVIVAIWSTTVVPNNRRLPGGDKGLYRPPYRLAPTQTPLSPDFDRLSSIPQLQIPSCYCCTAFSTNDTELNDNDREPVRSCDSAALGSIFGGGNVSADIACPTQVSQLRKLEYLSFVLLTTLTKMATGTGVLRGRGARNSHQQARTHTCSICQKTFKRSEHCLRHERGREFAGTLCRHLRSFE